MQPSFTVDGRVAVVTGGSSGIGRRFVQAYLDEGASVIAMSRHARDLESLAAKTSALKYVEADLTCSESINFAAEQAIGCFDRIDIVVNAAGVNPRKCSTELSLDEWNKTVALNLTAPFLLTKHLMPIMRKQGWGKVINIASLQSARAFPNGIAYGATKGGISQLTRAMAEEWSADGITVNAIAPGFFPTPLTEKVFEDPALVNQLAMQTCVGRNGQLDDLVGPLLFLSSSASDYVTGQVLFVDGGFTAK